MNLLDRFIEPTKDYIKCKDLLIDLSGMNGKPLYEIVRYLLCCDLYKLGFYHIDSNFKIESINSEDRDYTSDFLTAIKEVIRLGDHKDEELVYYSDEDLESFSSGTKEKIIDIIDCRDDYYFNKKELLGFEPLDGLLHFDTTKKEPPSNNNILIIELENRISELLDELADKDDSIEALLSKTGKNASVQQLIKEVADANAKIKQQEGEIKKLNGQLNKQSDDKELRPNSQTKVAHMLYAILKEHNYDLSPPKGKGTTNDQIVAASQTYKRPITKNFVANWLQRLHEIDIT